MDTSYLETISTLFITKIAQVTDRNNVLGIQNLLKHVPYSFGGKTGTLFGTLALHNPNELTLNDNSGVMTKVMNLATLAKVTGQVQIFVTVSGTGIVKIDGTPANLAQQINQVFGPLMQAAIARLKVGPTADKDFPGFTLPQAGVKFTWVTMNMPASGINSSSTATSTTNSTTTTATPVTGLSVPGSSAP